MMKNRHIEVRVVVGFALAALTVGGVLGVAALFHSGDSAKPAMAKRVGEPAQARLEESAQPTQPEQPVPVDPVDQALLEETYLTPEEAPGAWAHDTAAFPEPLPPGRSWPTIPPADLTTEGEVSEDGLSQVLVAYHWLCAWESEAVRADDRGDEKAAAAAVAQLEKFTGVPGIANKLQGADQWTEFVLVPARSGDLTNMRDEFEGSTCGGYRDREAAQ